MNNRIFEGSESESDDSLSFSELSQPETNEEMFNPPLSSGEEDENFRELADQDFSDSFSEPEEEKEISRSQVNFKEEINEDKEEVEPNSQEFNAKDSIEDILRCPICFGRVQNAQMCPSCSKICCETCIKRWITEQKPQCPHCRNTLFVEQLIPCRFFTDVSAELDKISKQNLALSSRSRNKEEECRIHKAPLYYFCATDGIAICSDCAMFDKSHAGHKFEHLRVVYQNHVEMVQKEASIIRKKIRELSSLISTVDTNIQSVTKAKEERANEMKVAFAEMTARLEAQLNVKWTTLKSQRRTMSEEMTSLNSILQQVDQSLINPRKGEFIEKSEQLISLLKQTHIKPIGNFASIPVSSEFDNEISPPYDSLSFKLCNFFRTRDESDVVWSETLFANGLLWRLKVYPNGNGVARGHYISVFLQMQQGLRETSKYQYKVEMINHKNSQLNVVREFASDFEEGECWGYNRFYQIDLLQREGFVSEDAENSIILRFYVRPLSYFQLARDQRRCIRQLQDDRTAILLREHTLQLQMDDMMMRTKRSNSGSHLESPKLKTLPVSDQNTSRNPLKVNRTSPLTKPETNRGILAHSDGNIVGRRGEQNQANFHSSMTRFSNLVTPLPPSIIDNFPASNPSTYISPYGGATLMGGTYDGSNDTVHSFNGNLLGPPPVVNSFSVPLPPPVPVPFSSTPSNRSISPTISPGFPTQNSIGSLNNSDSLSSFLQNPTLDYSMTTPPSNSAPPTPFLNVLEPSRNSPSLAQVLNSSGNANISSTRSSSSLDLDSVVSLNSDREMSPSSNRKLHRSWTASEVEKERSNMMLNGNKMNSRPMSISPNNNGRLPGATFEQLSPRSGGPLHSDNSLAADDLERDSSIVSSNPSFINNDTRFMNASIEWLDEPSSMNGLKNSSMLGGSSDLLNGNSWAQSSDLRRPSSYPLLEEDPETDYDFEPLEDYQSSKGEEEETLEEDEEDEDEEEEEEMGEDWRFRSQGDFSMRSSPQREALEDTKDNDNYEDLQYSPPARGHFDEINDSLNTNMLQEILKIQRNREEFKPSEEEEEDEMRFVQNRFEGDRKLGSSSRSHSEEVEEEEEDHRLSQDFGSSSQAEGNYEDVEDERVESKNEPEVFSPDEEELERTDQSFEEESQEDDEDLDEEEIPNQPAENS